MWRKLAFHNKVLEQGVNSVIAAGNGVLNHDTGFIEPPGTAMHHNGNWLFFGYQSMLRDCWLWHQVWFKHFNGFVPEFCRLRCYKVVVKVRNFIEAMQFFNLMQANSFLTGDITTIPGKVGMDERWYTDGHFNGFIYCDGPEDAQRKYADVRKLVDNHFHDGENIDIIIKRSCTEFEQQHGPTDQPFWNAMSQEDLDFQRHLEDIFKGQWTCAVQPDWLKNKLAHKFAKWANTVGDKTWIEYFGEDFLTMKAITYHQIERRTEK
jgi:hypothetical protein